MKFKKLELEEVGLKEYKLASKVAYKTLEKEGFKDLWENNDYQGLFKLCNKIRTEQMGLEPYTEDKFDKGWQYRTVLNSDYKVALEEFVNLIMGWW